MARKSQSRLQLSLLLLALILTISAAYYAYAASFTSTVTNPPTTAMVVQAGAANQLFNFSVTNNGAGNWTPAGETQSLWQYKSQITINGSTSLLNDYQVLVNLTSSNFNFSKANSQGNDTRFTWLNTSSGLEQNVSFWIENWSASGSSGNATLWVKVPNVTASSVANTTLYMYYGNPSASSASNGTNTFDFFDDFSGNAINAAKWSQTGTLSGTDHLGQNWAMADGDYGVHYNISTFTVSAGTYSIKAYDGSADSGRLEVYANNATIIGTLSADGKGYGAAAGPGAGGTSGGGGGGGYGGRGGCGHVFGGACGGDTGGAVYAFDGSSCTTSSNSTTNPNCLGSGGGNGNGFSGGAGGGLIKLIISNTLTNNGILSAVGYNAAGNCNDASGGGSGGTIYITAQTFAGTGGSISANGGNGYNGGCANSGGTGSGGRIAAYYAVKTYSGTTTVNEGGGNSRNPEEASGLGTIYEGAYPWSVASGELKGANTIGRLKSVPTFSSGVILETKSRYVSLPAHGYMAAGFYVSSSNGIGYRNNLTTDYYRNDTSWVAMAATAPASTNLLTKIAVKSASAVDLFVTNYNTGASYQSALNIVNTVSSEPITLGQRYDDLYAGEAYESYWDWVRVRKYSSSEPNVLSITPTVSITQVQVTLPSGFNYINNSNGTSAAGTSFRYNFTPAGESQAKWQYRKLITINGSATEQANYQVMINLTPSSFDFSKANSQGNDTRFTWLNTTSGLEQNISFWIENWTSGNATLWVKVPNVTASSAANTTLYMYYGNPSATYNNSLGGNNTFEFFDDFTNLDTTKWTATGVWTVSNGILNTNSQSARTDTYIPTAAYNDVVNVSNKIIELLVKSNYVAVSGTGNIFLAPQGINSQYFNDDSWPNDGTGGLVYFADISKREVIARNVWWKFKLINNGTSMSAYRDNVFNFSDTTSNLLNARFQFGHGASAAILKDQSWDYIFVRKYASPEPSVLSIGAEQQNGLTWSNTTASGFVASGATQYFWFNASVPATLGNYSFNVTTLDTLGLYNSTIVNVSVKSITLTESLSPTISNPSDSITVSGQATLNPDGTSVANNSINVFLDGVKYNYSENSALKTGAWWNTSWLYRKAITINGSSSALADYQLPINLTTILYNNTGLVGSWHFTNNDTSDSSGYGNNGVQYGGVNCTVTGKFGGGCQFDGSNDYVSVPASNNWDFGTNDFALTAWVKLNQIGPGTQKIISRATNQYMGLSVPNTGKVAFYVGNGAWQDITTITSTDTITPTVWTYVVLTRVSGTTKLYFNGVQESSGVLSFNNLVGGGNLEIGATSTYGDYFNGTIDEVRIYNRTLNATEISDLYNATKSRLDYQDLRFSYLNQSSGAEQNISYWMENDNQAWVKVPNVTASTVANTTLYMYYGNPSAASASNGTNTFDFFDDFSDGDMSDWSTYNGAWSASNYYISQTLGGIRGNHAKHSTASFGRDIAIEARVKYDSGRENGIVYAQTFDTGRDGDNGYIVDYYAGMIRLYGNQGGCFNCMFYFTKTVSMSLVSGNWYTLRLAITGSSSISATLVESGDSLSTTNSIYTTGGVGLNVYDSAGSWDDIRVRKYSSPEPSVLSTGSQQSATVTNSTGGYNYTFTAPATAGTHTVKINLTDANGIVGTNTTTFDVRTLVFDQFNLSDRDGQLNGILNPGEAYNVTVRIQETNSTVNYTVSSGTFNVTVSGTNYPLAYTGSGGVWKTNATYGTAASSIGTYSFLANITGTSGNGISNLTQMNNNYTYFVKQLNITYQINDSALYATESSLINGTVYREPEHAASVNTPVQGSVNSGNLTVTNWWNTSWLYRKAITINGSTSALTDYQILVNLTSSSFNFSKANSQGNDTRFTWLNTTSGLEQNIPFWIENWTASGSLGNATIWVKVPNVMASTVANTTLYMYYGNPSATYNNSMGGNSTFEFFDDFEAGTVPDITKWTINAGSPTVSGGELTIGSQSRVRSKGNFSVNTSVISRVKVAATSSGSAGFLGFADGTGDAMSEVGGSSNTAGFTSYFSSYTNGYMEVRKDGTTTEPTITFPAARSSYNVEEIRRNSTTAVIGLQNGATFGNSIVTTNIPTGNLPIYLGNWISGGSKYDYILVRSYASPEPSTLSIGAEQTTTTTTNSAAYSFTYTPNSSVTSITNVNFTLNATDSDGITNYTASPQGVITVYPQIAVDTWASTTSACSGRVSDFNNSGALFLCANVTYGSVAGLGGENVRFTVYKNGINNEKSQNPVFNVTNTTAGYFKPAGESQAAWQYRKALTINGSASALSDYQLPINLTTAIYNNTGLVGSWHFTNNDTSDSSGSGNNGVQNGGVNCSATGKFGGGCGFDGTSGYIDAGTASIMDLGTGNFTVEFWAKIPPGTAGSNQEVLSKAVDAAKDTGFGFWFNENLIDMYVADGAGSAEASNYGPFSPDVWYYFTGKRESGRIKLFINGTLVDDQDASTLGSINTAAHLLFSKPFQTGDPYFNGTVDEVKIYDRALSAAEIQEHYSAGKSRLDYQDLRFTWLNSTSNAEQNISYWLESDNQAWVKVPNVTASTVANATLYMYYGNPTAASASNVTATFGASSATSAIPGCTLGQGCIVSANRTINVSGSYGHPYIRINPGVALNISGNGVIVNFSGVGRFDIKGTLSVTAGGNRSIGCQGAGDSSAPGTCPGVSDPVNGGAYSGTGSGGVGGSGAAGANSASGSAGGTYGGGGGGSGGNGVCTHAGGTAGASYGGGGGEGGSANCGASDNGGTGAYLSINATIVSIENTGMLKLIGENASATNAIYGGGSGGGGALLQILNVSLFFLNGNITVIAGNGTYRMFGGGGGGALAYLQYQNLSGRGIINITAGSGGSGASSGGGGSATLITPDGVQTGSASGASGGDISKSGYTAGFIGGSEPSVLSTGAQETPAVGVASTSFTPNESSQYSLNVTAWNVNINPSVTATASRAFEFGQLNVSSVNYDTTIYTTETAVVSGLIRDFMNSSWLNNATTTNITISATSGTFNANWTLVNSTGGFNFTYTPPALSSSGSATITINASYGNITGGWSGTISITPAIAVDTWATNASCASRPSAISEVPTVLNDTGLVGYWKFNSVNATNYTADSSGMNNNGQVLGGAALTPNGKFGAGMQFDGVDDYVDAGNAASLNIGNAITIEAWVKPTGYHQNGWGGILIQDFNSNTRRVLVGNDGSITSEFIIGGQNRAPGASAGSVLFGLWTNIVLTYNGSEIVFWVNGVKQIPTDAAGSVQATSVITAIGWGANTEWNYHFNGTIDEVRIWNRSLSAEEIAQHYNRTALSLCANVTYGQNKMAGAYVNLTVNRTGHSVYGSNPANTITNLYDAGTVVSTEITPDESTKYTVTAKAWNPDVSSAVASGTYGYAYGKVNTTIALSDNIIYDSETSQVSGKVYDWMNENWTRNTTTWWNSSWPNRKSITINGSTTALTDYQANLTIIWASGMNTTFDDLRFTYLNSSGNSYDNMTKIFAREEISEEEAMKLLAEEKNNGQEMNPAQLAEFEQNLAKTNWLMTSLPSQVYILYQGKYINFSAGDAGMAELGLTRLADDQLAFTGSEGSKLSLQSGSPSPRALSGIKQCSEMIYQGGKVCQENNTFYRQTWKYFRNLGRDEEVLTLNQKTGAYEWQKPKERISENYAGELYEIELETGNRILVTPSQRVYGAIENESVGVRPVMVPQVVKENSISFDLKSEDKTADMDSFEVAHISPQVLEMVDRDMIAVDDLLYLLPDSDCKRFVPGSKLVENGSQPVGHFEREAHFNPMSLSSSSRVILECGPFSILLSSSTNDSFRGSSSTGCQSILSQNSSSSFDNFRVLRYLSNMSLLITSSRPASDQLTQRNESILCLKDSSNGTVMHAIYISPLALNFSSASSFLRSPSLNTSGQFMSGLLSIRSLSSSGIENVVLIIAMDNTSYLCNCIDICKCVKVFKALETPKNRELIFNLEKITDVYDKLIQTPGTAYYFLDENKNPVKAMEIRKVPYSGTVYDVDVENDVILVKRDGSDRGTWSGNQNAGTEVQIPYWIENYTAGVNATVWIRTNLTTGSNTIYMYYGNTSAASASNGTNTFIFFDDFNTDFSRTLEGGFWLVNSTKWIEISKQDGSYFDAGVSGELRVLGQNNWNWHELRTKSAFPRPVIFEWSQRIPSQNFDAAIGYGFPSTVWTDIDYQSGLYFFTNPIYRLLDGTGSSTFTGVPATSQTLKMALPPSAGFKMYVDGTLYETNTTYAQDNWNFVIIPQEGFGRILYMDNLRVRKYASPEPSTLSVGSAETQSGATVSLSATGGTILSNVSTNSTGGYSTAYTPPPVTSIQNYTIHANATDTDGLNSSAVSTQIKVYPAPSKLNASIYTDRAYYNLGENVTIGVVMRNNESALFTGALLRAKIYRNDTGSLVGTVDLPERAGYFVGSYIGAFNTTALPVDWYYINITSEADSYGAPLSGSGKLFYVNPFRFDIGLVSPSCAPSGQATQGETQRYDLEARNYTTGLIITPLPVSSYWNTSSGLQFSEKLDTYDGIPCSLSVDIIPSNIQEIPGGISLTKANATYGGSDASRMLEYVMKYPFWDDNMTDMKFLEKRVPVEIDNRLSPQIQNAFIEINGSELEAAGVQLSSMSLDSIRVVDPRKVPEWPDELWGSEVPYNITDYGGDGHVNQSDKIRFLVNLSENAREYVYIYYTNLSSGFSYAGTSLSGTPYAPYIVKPFEEAPVLITSMRLDKQIYTRYPTVTVNYSIYTPNPSPYPPTVTNTFLQCKIYSPSGSLEVDTGITQIYNNTYIGSKEMSTTSGLFGEYTLICTATDQVAGKTNIYSQKFLEEEIGTPVYLYPVSFTTTSQTFSISGNTSIASSGAALPEAYVNMSTLACESTFWRGLFGLGPYCEAYQNSTVSNGAGEYSATLTLTIPSDYFDLHVGSNHTYSYANGTFLASGYIYGSNTTQYSVKYAAATNLWLLADNSPYSPVTLNLQMNTTSTTQQGVNVTYEILNKTSGLSYVNLSSDIVVLNASGGGVNYFTKNWTVDYLPVGEYTVVARLMQGDWVAGTDSATFYRMNLTHGVNTTDTYTNEPIYLDGTLYWPNGTAADENLKVQYTGADVGRLTQNFFTPQASGGTYGMATPLRIPDNNYTLRVASARVMGDDAAKGLSEEAGIKVRLRVLSMLGSGAAQYKANTAVNLTLRANSTANWTVSPVSAFNATDRDTFVQAQYNSTWNASLPGMIAFENRTRSYLWNTTNNPPGNYTIASGIIDAYGQLAGTANTTVEIITTKTAAISSSLDKSAYGMYEIVNISGTINRTGNVEFSGNLTVYVVNQNTGTVCSYCSCGQAYVVIANDSKTTPVAFSYGWNTSSYLAGNYLAVSNFTWVDEDGISRSIVSQKTFTIDIVRLAGVSVTTSNTTYALTSPTFNITAAVVNKGNWYSGAGAGGGNLTVKATDMAGNDDTPTTQGGVYLNAPWYKNPIPTVCNYNSSNYNYTWSTWLYNNKPLNYMPNGLLYVFDKMRDAGNYTIRANYTFEGGSAFSEEKNITVLQSAALTQPPTFYISKKGEPYEGDATNPILAYANEGRWFGLIVTNAGNVEMQNLTANFTVGCSSPPLTLGPYPVKTTLGVGSTNTYMLYENASIPWNTRQTPVNGDQNPCVVNALLYTPAIYDGCPMISGGVCVWFDSLTYEPSQAKALNIKKTETMRFNVTINNSTFTSTNADAVVGGTINNTGNVWLNGTISGKIYSISGAEVATMSCTPPGIIYLALSPAQAVNCTWNTGLTEAVNYTANITYNWGTGSNATGIPFSISAIKRASVYVFANASAHNQSADVSITGNVSNIGNYNVTGNLTLRFMQGESIIETINTTNNITIGVAGAFNFTFALNTKGYPYGLYNVTATYTYLNENGNATNATGNYLLTINENRSITLSMDTDRASYKSNWGVNITVDLNNTGNAALSGASLIYTVKQGATPVATYTDNLGDSTVSIGEAYKRSWLWNTGTYAAGTYTVEARVSDSTLASWTRTKDIQVNTTKTASIAGLAVDVMPPSNYSLGDTIYVYGIINATGNVLFSGNLSLKYHNNQLVADTYDNRAGVATGFSMSPPVTGSATAIDVGVINLTATYLWIDEDGAARSTSSSATFFIGGTSVTVTFGATNTYNSDDAVPLLVHVAGMGGNITGLTIGNFTITDGVDTYTPPMAEQGSGNYLFTFAKNAFDIGDYAISVTVIDPATSVPGTGTANLYIRDHWITVRVDANSALASSEADAGQGYAAAKSGQALVALVQRGGALDSLSATANSLVMKQKLTANRFNLVMTQGSVKENIRDRIKLIVSGEFEKYASPSFGFALAKDYHVSVSRIYDAIDLIGVNVGTFRPGMYNLIIKNDGASNGKTKIVVSRK